MLLLREHIIGEAEKIKDILIKQGIKDLNLDGIVYVVIDNTDLVGAAKVKLKYEKWMLEYLVIREDKRNQGLGDGLLRAILNKLYNKGIENIYCEINNAYLIKKGFSLVTDDELQLNIVDFFNEDCSSWRV